MTAKNIKTVAEFLTPGRRVILTIQPEMASGMNFALDETATIHESSPLGLLVTIHMHESKGGETVAFVTWPAISALFAAD